uniref:Uncharacterized protein n=1 Tax=Helianthus annuus TaxID=4232 RepID=A0A251VR75_HELAN
MYKESNEVKRQLSRCSFLTVLETAWSTIKQKHHQLQGFVMIQMQKWKYTAAFANKEVVFFVIHITKLLRYYLVYAT